MERSGGSRRLATPNRASPGVVTERLPIRAHNLSAISIFTARRSLSRLESIKPIGLSRASVTAKQRQSGSVGGWLYGLNTLGGFVGTLAGGFLLLPGFGLLKSTLAGAGTSLAVGTLVWLLSDSILRQERAPAVAASKAAAPGMAWILPLYATSGFIAMSLTLSCPKFGIQRFDGFAAAWGPHGAPLPAYVLHRNPSSLSD